MSLLQQSLFSISNIHGNLWLYLHGDNVELDSMTTRVRKEEMKRDVWQGSSDGRVSDSRALLWV